MRTTEQGQPHVHPQWSVWEQRHLWLCLHWQSLGMPCQRKETASYSWLEHSSPSIVLAEISSNIKYWNIKYHWTTYFLLLFFCSCIYTKTSQIVYFVVQTFGSTPVGLWAQACKTITLPSGIFCWKDNADDWEYKYMNKTCSHVDLESWTCFIIFQKEFWKLFIQKFKKKC